MRTVWNVYVVDQDGKEAYLCQVRQPDALAAVLRSLAILERHGPAGYRIIRLEVENDEPN